MEKKLIRTNIVRTRINADEKTSTKEQKSKARMHNGEHSDPWSYFRCVHHSSTRNRYTEYLRIYMSEVPEGVVKN